jgi:hypothetical protein
MTIAIRSETAPFFFTIIPLFIALMAFLRCINLR